MTSGLYREETLRSAYLYQIYAYLRSQAPGRPARPGDLRPVDALDYGQLHRDDVHAHAAGDEVSHAVLQSVVAACRGACSAAVAAGPRRGAPIVTAVRL